MRVLGTRRTGRPAIQSQWVIIAIGGHVVVAVVPNRRIVIPVLPDPKVNLGRRRAGNEHGCYEHVLPSDGDGNPGRVRYGFMQTSDVKRLP